jgi:hypothetical protein
MILTSTPPAEAILSASNNVLSGIDQLKKLLEGNGVSMIIESIKQVPILYKKLQEWANENKPSKDLILLFKI